MTRAKELREAGAVKRMHTVPIIGEYNIALHSWNMATLLIDLYPEASKELLMAVLLHDVAERWMGDTPSPAKWWINPKLGEELKKSEDELLKRFNLAIELTDREKAWLKGLDILELAMFCDDQINFGNYHIENISLVCEQILTHDASIPREIKSFFNGRQRHRTTDKP